MEKKKTDSSVGIFLIIFVVLWICTGNPILLYSGYGLLMGYTMLKLLFSNTGGIIEMYPLTKQLFIFGLFSVVSIFWSIDKVAAFNINKFIIPCIVMVIVLSNYFIKEKNSDILILTIAILGIALSGYVIFKEGGIMTMYSQSTSSIEGVRLSSARVGGDVHNTNFISAQCSYSAIVLFYYALFSKKRICYILALLPMVVSILTGSRGGNITMIAGIIFLLYFYQKRDKSIKKYLLVLVGIIVLVPIVIYIFSTDFFYTLTHRFTDMFDAFFSDSHNQDGSVSHRIKFIEIGLKQFFNNPVVGLGHGGSVKLYSSTIARAQYAHNDYIEMIVCGGFIGVVLYYRMFVNVIKNYRNIMKNSDDHRYIISYVILLMLLISNITTVNYYNVITVYLFFILWTTQIEVYKSEHETPKLENQFEDNYYFRR